MKWSGAFRAMSGTVTPAAGYPTGMSRNGRSFDGRPRIVRRKSIGLGVWVSEASPALWMAAIRMPAASPNALPGPTDPTIAIHFGGGASSSGWFSSCLIAVT